MKILFFTMNMEIWAHTLPEITIAKFLKTKHKIKFLSCGKNQNYCQSIHMKLGGIDKIQTDKLENKIKKICKMCCLTSSMIKKELNVEVDLLKNYLTVQEKENIIKLINNTQNQQLFKLTFKKINYGLNSIYDFLLEKKKMSLNLTQNEFEEYRVILKNSLFNLIAFSNYLKTYKPDVVMCFSPQYFSNINAVKYAQSLNIKVLFMESGVNWGNRLGTMRIWDWKKYKMNNPAKELWLKNKIINKKLDFEKLIKIKEHYNELIKGRMHTVYSSKPFKKVNLKEKLNINNKKVILATLSSFDEAYAAYIIGGFEKKKFKSTVYNNQFEWISNLIKWVEKNDYFLIVRVHPRDFPNKREDLLSEQAKLLKRKLIKKNKNIYVNWPEDNISFYDLLSITDVITTGWSITAVEALALGLPAVTYDYKIHSYPRDILLSGTSKKIYYQNLKKAILEGWSIKNSIKGMRWLGFNYVENNIFINKKIGAFERTNNFLIFRIMNHFKMNTIFGRRYSLRRTSYDEREMISLNKMIHLNKTSIAEIKNKKKSYISKKKELFLVYETLKKIPITVKGYNQTL
jgi:hypothetical protein